MRPGSESPPDELATMIASRLALATSGMIVTGQRQWTRIDNWPALLQEFSVKSTSDSVSRETNVVAKGLHLLVRTDWGILEMHAVAPVDRFAERRLQYDRLLTDLRLNPPLSLDQQSESTAVSPFLGSWKAYRSRVRLLADGRIVIKVDAPRPAVVDASLANPRRALTGRFDTRDDLLQIQWDDGSRTNYRWRIVGDDLLLTDHEGQISQLHRILE